MIRQLIHCNMFLTKTYVLSSFEYICIPANTLKVGVIDRLQVVYQIVEKKIPLVIISRLVLNVSTDRKKKLFLITSVV